MIIRAEWMINPKYIAHRREKNFHWDVLLTVKGFLHFAWWILTVCVRTGWNYTFIIMFHNKVSLDWMQCLVPVTLWLFSIQFVHVSVNTKAPALNGLLTHLCTVLIKQRQAESLCFSPSVLPLSLSLSLSHINKPIWLFGRLDKQFSLQLPLHSFHVRAI